MYLMALWNQTRSPLARVTIMSACPFSYCGIQHLSCILQIMAAESCSDLYRVVGQDFWLATWCNSTALEGYFFILVFFIQHNRMLLSDIFSHQGLVSNFPSFLIAWSGSVLKEQGSLLWKCSTPSNLIGIEPFVWGKEGVTWLKYCLY